MNNTLLADVRGELNDPIAVSVTGIKNQHNRCMLLTEPLLTARVNAQKLLTDKSFQYRRPKDKEYTDFDRRVMLDGDVSSFMADYELLKGLETLLGERLKVLSSLLLQIPHGSK